MGKDKIAVVVMSCDAYYDTWEIFIQLFRKYFSNCNYPVILSTEKLENAKKLPFDRIVYSDEKEWSGRLKDTLAQIKYEYIFLMLDDFWLNKPVDKALFEEDVEYLIKNDIGAIYLDYVDWKFLKIYDEKYLEWPQNKIYRINTRCGLWKADFLKSVLVESENIWEFERNSINKANANNEIVLCRKTQYLGYTFGITAGKYERSAVRLAKREGYELALSYRAQRSFRETIGLKIRNFIFDLNPELVDSILGKIRNSNEY